ncbi:MAG: ATP-binding cassette domain-containing protein [Gemmatimonadales bacterium]
MVLILVWGIASSISTSELLRKTSPLDVLAEAGRLLASSPGRENWLVSVTRLLSGVFLGGIVGVALGALTSQSTRLDAFCRPSIQFLSAIPIVVWLPLIAILVGLGETLKVVLLAIATFFVLFASAHHGGRSVHVSHLEAGMLYEKGPFERLARIVLPASLPEILAGVRLSLGLGWIVLFLAEFAVSSSGPKGIGHHILIRRSYGDLAETLGGVLIVGATALFFELVLWLIQRIALRWREDGNSVAGANIRRWDHLPTAKERGALSVDLQSVGYEDAASVLGKMQFDLLPGEVVALLGPSGSGKTTLLRTIAGLHSTYTGSVSLAGIKILRPSLPIGLASQDAELFPWRSSVDNITFAANPSPGKGPQDARDLLKALGVATIANSWPRELSGGEADRVALCRLLAGRPGVLLIDEPLKSVGGSARTAVIGAIRQAAARDRSAVLFTTHDLEDAAELATRVMMIRGEPATFVFDQQCGVTGSEQRAAVFAALRTEIAGGQPAG